MMRKLTAIAILFGIAACSGSPGAGVVPAGSHSPIGAMDNASALPGDNASALPGDNASALPGDNASALPGDNASALPGAKLACNDVFAVDQANCTVAINLNVAAIANAATPATLLPGLHPTDLHTAYGLPQGTGTPTVAIVDAYDNPNAESDLAVYRAAYGLPACTSANGCFTKMDEHGGTAYPSFNGGWAQEISLDLDMVSAVCPNCKILLVEANSSTFDDLGAGVDAAVAAGAKYVSNSYYGPEWSGERNYDVHYHHSGVAITVSSGDQRSTFYPAASPNVTAVGGTSLSYANGTWTESAWAYDGDGCSKYEPKPSWQGNTGCQYARSAVDVAAVADPQTGVSMYNATSGGWLVAGGTSVGAPIVAAAYALSGNPQGPAYSYEHRTSFTDIAPAGYDKPTGLGSPRGVGGL